MWVPNLENIKQVAKNAGLDDIAVTGVEPIVEARAAIEERKRQGLHAGMNFTYGNPSGLRTQRCYLKGHRAFWSQFVDTSHPPWMSLKPRTWGPK